ncbi:MAG: hypothetical protein ACKO35_16335, partial [Planctomycetaceae bacterium]
ASAPRQATWASLRMPVQSTTQRTIGLPAPSMTRPIASRGSSYPTIGLIQLPQHPWPSGGVTSKRNEAT